MKRMIALMIAVTLLVVGCSSPTEPQHTDADGSGNWVPGEEIETLLNQALYSGTAPKADLYINTLEEQQEPLIVNQGTSATLEFDGETYTYDPQQIYPVYSLGDVRDEEFQQQYKNIGEGKSSLEEELEPAELFKIQLKDENEELVAYYGVVSIIDGEEYLNLVDQTAFAQDYAQLFADHEFQQQLIDTQMDLDQLTIYPIDRLGFFDINGLLFVDGSQEYIYTDAISYHRKGPWVELLQITNGHIDLEQGFYPAASLVDLIVEELETLQEKDVYIDGKDDDYYWSLLEQEASSQEDQEVEEEVSEEVPEETESESSEPETAEEPSLNLLEPDENMTGGTPLTNPGIPEGEESGTMEDSE